MKKLTIAILAVPLLAFSGAVFAGDAEAGKAKVEALYCLDCHAGEDFEGMSLEDITAALKGVVAGEHPEGAEELKAEDIPDVAAFLYAAGGGQ